MLNRATGITRKDFFLTAEEKEEGEKLTEMEDAVTAVRDVYISKNHQNAMAMDSDDDCTVESQLTKGGVAPPENLEDTSDPPTAPLMTMYRHLRMRLVSQRLSYMLLTNQKK